MQFVVGLMVCFALDGGQTLLVFLTVGALRLLRFSLGWGG